MPFSSTYSMTVHGKSVNSKKTFEACNPANGEVIATVPDASRQQLDAAVAAARSAFIDWSKVPLAERQKYVDLIGTVLEDNREDFIRLLTKEQGKPRQGAEWEIGGSIAWCRALARQDIPVDVVDDTPSRTVITRRAPIGVVGAITPWNFPVLLAIWKIAPALLAGNTVVLKPSPFTPLCTLKLGELLRGKLPPGVLNVVSGGNDLGQWMTEHQDIGKISFTGSTATGRKIMASCSGNLKRITLELGGNDPAIVLPDVDIAKVAKELFWAAFQNSAQFCVAAKRMYIHDDIYEPLSAAIVDYAKTIKVGDGADQGSDLGPIQNRMQYDKLKDLLADTRSNGFKFLLGGAVADGPGNFIPVTIIDNPPDDSRVVREEAFGPILPLLRFSDIDEVIQRANDTEYGLAASVWSADTVLAASIAQRLEAGTVWINEIHTFGPHIAFAGHKQSGVGIENALDGILEYTNPQTIVTRAA